MNKKAMRKTLSSLPRGITETYDQTMERIRSQGTGSSDIAQQALAWICNVGRPISVKELQHALATQPGDVCTSFSGTKRLY